MSVQQRDQSTKFPADLESCDNIVIGRPFHSAEFVRQIEKAIESNQSIQQIAAQYSTTPYIVNLIRRRVYVSQLLSDPLLTLLNENKSLLMKYRIAGKILQKYQALLLDAFRDEFPEDYNPIKAVLSILNISCVNAKAAPFYTLLGLMVENTPGIHLHDFECLFLSPRTRKIAYTYMRRYIFASAHCYLLRCARKRIGYRKRAAVSARSRLKLQLRIIGCSCVFDMELG